jgi:hypothetical protein
MFSSLRNHPFAVEAFFESSIVLTFAVPKEQLKNLIPDCLVLDTFNDQWAFIAIAMVQTKGLRPKGFPNFFGNNFFLIGYRIFVRYTTNAGKRLRGLFILKSETDKRNMEFLGNIFTRYKYTTTDIMITREQQRTKIKSIQSKFEIEIESDNKEVILPGESPFSDWKDARRFAGPLPFTISYDTDSKQVLIVEGVRKNWVPAPIKVIHHEHSFLTSLNLKYVRLASAFMLTDIPYYWKKGKVEKWNG